MARRFQAPFTWDERDLHIAATALWQRSWKHGLTWRQNALYWSVVHELGRRAYKRPAWKRCVCQHCLCGVDVVSWDYSVD